MLNDVDLVRKARSDDQNAFCQLVERYQHYVYRIVYTRIPYREDAEDVTQETFANAFLRIKQIREPHKFKHWLSRIAANTCTDWLRSRRQEREVASPLDVEEPSTLNEQSLQNHTDAQRLEGLWDAVNSLPEIHREVVILHYFDGYTYEEISEALDIPVSTVQGRLQMARSRLRTEFSSAVVALNLSQLQAPDGLVQKVMESIRHLSPVPKGNVGRIIPSLLIIGTLTLMVVLLYAVRYRRVENPQQVENQSQKSIIFYDDFEDGDVSDWIGGYYTGQADLDGKQPGTPSIIAARDAAASGNLGLQFTREAGFGNTAIVSSPELGSLTTTFQIDFDIIPGESWHHFSMGKSAPHLTQDETGVIMFGLNLGVSAGVGRVSLYAQNHPRIGYYTPNTFYHVTMIVDPTTSRFDITITGTLRDMDNNPVHSITMTDVPFVIPVSSSGALRYINLFQNNRNASGMMGLDNVSIRVLSTTEIASPAQ